jgi:hypothetical protein
MSNESFTFDYNDKCGVELEFKPRGKGDYAYCVVIAVAVT